MDKTAEEIFDSKINYKADKNTNAYKVVIEVMKQYGKQCFKAGEENGVASERGFEPYPNGYENYEQSLNKQ